MGDEVYAQRVGDAVILFPKEKAWETFLEGVNEFTDDYFTALESGRDEIPSAREVI
jgi:antitoxin VapB